MRTGQGGNVTYDVRNTKGMGLMLLTLHADITPTKPLFMKTSIDG